MLQLNDVPVPQRIGTTLIRNDEITLIPPQRITPLPADVARVFDTLEDYMYALIEARRASDMIGTDDADRSRAHIALARLASELPPIMARLSSPVYRRCVLRHDDLRDTNVLLDGSRISGIVDWEYHSTIPVVLAAQPPCWIRYDGIYDPRFTDTALETWWLASPEDASRLRAVYPEVSWPTFELPVRLALFTLGPLDCQSIERGLLARHGGGGITAADRGVVDGTQTRPRVR